MDGGGAHASLPLGCTRLATRFCSARRPSKTTSMMQGVHPLRQRSPPPTAKSPFDLTRPTRSPRWEPVGANDLINVAARPFPSLNNRDYSYTPSREGWNVELLPQSHLLFAANGQFCRPFPNRGRPFLRVWNRPDHISGLGWTCVPTCISWERWPAQIFAHGVDFDCLSGRERLQH